MTSPVEADLNREFARQDKHERAERMITDAEVHDSLVEAMTGPLGAKAVRMLRGGAAQAYNNWVTLGVNLHGLGVDLQRLVEILTECFSDGEDIEREFSDMLDEVWIKHRAACVQAARESALRRSGNKTGGE